MQRFRKRKTDRPLANAWVVGRGFKKQSFNLELLSMAQKQVSGKNLTML